MAMKIDRDMVIMVAAAYVMMRGPEDAAKDVANLGKGVAEFVMEFTGGLFRGVAGAVGIPDPGSDAGKSACCGSLAGYQSNKWNIFRALTYCSASDVLAWSRSNAATRPSFCRQGGGATGTW